MQKCSSTLYQTLFNTASIHDHYKLILNIWYNAMSSIWLVFTALAYGDDYKYVRLNTFSFQTTFTPFFVPSTWLQSCKPTTKQCYSSGILSRIWQYMDKIPFATSHWNYYWEYIWGQMQRIVRRFEMHNCKWISQQASLPNSIHTITVFSGIIAVAKLSKNWDTWHQIQWYLIPSVLTF